MLSYGGGKMSNLVFRVHIDNEFFKEFLGKEIKNYLIDWDGKLRNGIILKTSEGNVKIVDAAVLNPNKNEGKQVTEIFLEKV